MARTPRSGRWPDNVRSCAPKERIAIFSEIGRRRTGNPRPAKDFAHLPATPSLRPQGRPRAGPLEPLTLPRSTSGQPDELLAGFDHAGVGDDVEAGHASLVEGEAGAA